jgi:hypothetical protein
MGKPQMTSSQLFQPIKSRDVKEVFGISEETFRKWRRQGRLVEGADYFQHGDTGSVLYNKPMILDFLANFGNPSEHLKAVEAFRASLPSAGRKKPGPKKSA